MPNFYATTCLKDGNHYVKVVADNMGEARAKMFNSKYGDRWAFMYTEAQKAEAIDQFGTTCIDTIGEDNV